MFLEPTEARTGGGSMVQEAWLGLRRWVNGAGGVSRAQEAWLSYRKSMCSGQSYCSKLSNRKPDCGIGDVAVVLGA